MEDDSNIDAVRAALAPRYRVEREIGRGAFATVFLATDLATARDVAVKILKPHVGQAVARERFLREIRVSGQLQHENILPLLDSGEMGGFLFFAMPYVDGGTLRHQLRRERQMKMDDVLRITRDVAAGLTAAHSRGVLHRDVKPENILLHNGRALVADFGIAKAFTDAGVDTITSTGIGIGTPGYMSPEQASGERQLDERSDVYGLACMVFEMLSGETPFTGISAQAIVAKKLSQPVPSIRVFRETLSPRFDAVLRRGLAKVPADRYSTVAEFLDALISALQAGESADTVSMRGTISRAARTHPIATTLVIGTIAVLGAWLVMAIRSPGAGWVGGRPQSVVIIPFYTSTSSAQERALAVTLAETITRELNQWESIRAVPAVSLAGPMFDLGLQGPSLQNEAEGVRVARQVRVQALVSVLVRVRGDSVQAEATLIDVTRERPVDRPVQATAALSDLGALARPIVSDILGLGTTGGDPAELRRKSAFPAAVVADMEGMQFLDRGRLAEAERSFRRAIAVDSTFALAKHHLALSLFLEARPSDRQLTAMAPLIAQLSTASASQARGLLRRDSLRIAAFHAFQSGDYEGSRAAYRDILAADPTDVYALLMRGTVESEDPWLVALPNGAYRPRGNANIATRDVSEILRLQPTFDLGYSNLSDVHLIVSQAAERGTCQNFEIPRNAVRLPWQSGTPEQQRSFCPVILNDSIVWMSKADFDAFDKSLVRAGANRFFEGYIALLRRWATYAESEFRPREQLVTALLAQRQRQGIAAPARIAAFADTALRFAESALALKPDTTPDDLARLANLYLGVGDYARSLAIAERLVRPGTGRGGAGVVTPRIVTAHPFMATGQPSRALQVVSAARPVQRFIPDPSTGALVPFGGAEPVISRIQVLGATGVGGEALRRELGEVQRLWSDSRYTERQRRALREAVTMSLATALMLDSTSLASWDRNVTVTDPLWRSLAAGQSDTAQAKRLLRSSIDSGSARLSEATRSYLHGVIASRLGDHRLAISQFTRMDSIPLRLDNVMDVGWGLRSLSELRRAQSYEALRDTANARLHYAAFMKLWAPADTLARMLVQEAARRSAQLGKSD